MIRAHPFAVEVRRPLHRPDPRRRLSQRWRARNERRRAARAAPKDDDKARWWDFLDIPLDGGFAAAVAVAAAILLVVLLVIAGPFLWILILFAVEIAVWLILAIAGLLAWLVLRRPWQVVITDESGTTVASVHVSGRRHAREHAQTVEQRLDAGMTPDAAVQAF